MIFLPKCVAPTCQLAGDSATRFNLSAVRLIELEHDSEPWWRLEATDGRVLGIVRGPSDPSVLDQRSASLLPEVEGFPLGLVGADTLAKALNGLARGARRGDKSVPQLALLLLANEVVMAAGESVSRYPLADGRFPDVEAVLPKEPAPTSFTVNPYLLIDLLKAAGAVCPEGEERVEVLFWSAKSPIGVIARGEKGITFDGIIMPLA